MSVKGLPPEVEDSERYLKAFSKAVSVQSVQSFPMGMIIRCVVIIVIFLLNERREVK